MSEFKSGFVSIVGRTNVGKSTLLNNLVEEDVVITANKPQTTRQNAKKAAIEHLLTKKYPWLNSSDYNEFVKKTWVSKYENTLYDPKTRRKEEAANWSNPTANFKGYYQIKYDENGKEISRKKLN